MNTEPVVPMSSPDLGAEDIKAVVRVLKSRHLSRGPVIESFEKAVAEYAGSEHAVAVSSGTTGLHLAVIAAGIKEGDMVITTSFSFIASANVILYQRAVPVFVDVDPDSLNIDPKQVALAVQDLLAGGDRAQRWLPRPYRNGRREIGKLKAVLVVDTYGQPADYDAIRKITDRHELALIEDACEALGSSYKGRKTGALGNSGVFAFYPNKQITTGEGGVLLTDRDQDAALFRSLRNQGRSPEGRWLSHDRLGYNYRLDEMSAALGLSQLGKIESLLGGRSRVAGWYNERLDSIPEVQIPYLAPETSHMSWFVYVMQAQSREMRDHLRRFLAASGVPSRIYFPPIHLQPFYIDAFSTRRGDYPAAEHAGDTCLALPFSSVMKENEVDLVCDTLKKALTHFNTA